MIDEELARFYDKMYRDAAEISPPSILEFLPRSLHPGGVNIVTAHTTNGHFFQSGLAGENYYPEPWGLHAAYSDWKIYFYEEMIARGGIFDDGSPMYNQNSYLLAQKPTAP